MATSKLQCEVSNFLSIHFGEYTIRENIRPDFLITQIGERLELDFLIEELGIAIEVQGIQHYVFVPHFHGDYSSFKQRLAWDAFKRERCHELGLNLIEISGSGDICELLEFLPSREVCPKQLPSRIVVPRRLKGKKLRWFKQLSQLEKREEILQERLVRVQNLQHVENIKIKIERIRPYITRLKELLEHY